MRERPEQPGGAPSGGSLDPDERVLVQLITLQAQARSSEAWLYRAIEAGAEVIARQALGRRYARRLLLRDSAATPEGLVGALREATSQQGVRAVDVLLNPHGTSARILFTDRSVDSAEVADLIRTSLSDEQRDRLRVLFSTACFGRTHIADWLASGFVAAVGATGVYADGATSLPSLLRSWASGSDVATAVTKANASDSGGVQDRIAALFYRLTGREKLARSVDSRRIAQGAIAVTITSDPGQTGPS